MKKFYTYIHVLSYVFLIATLVVPLSATNKDDVENEKVLFANQTLLNPLFEKLYLLEENKTQKVNIVHVGDSHIQADFLTNIVRQALQEQFGNGGYGFTFPYSLMRTNGSDQVKYSSNATWESRLNVSPVSRLVDIGLSGIGLYSGNSDFTIQLNTNKNCTFNSIKVLYSTKKPQYNLSLTDNPITLLVEEERESIGSNKPIIHNIKRGENLSVIAARYKITVKALKAENSLTSDAIQAGRKLRIPSSARIKRKAKVVKKSVDFVDLQTHDYYSSYISATPLNRVSVFSKGDNSKYDINGFVLENDKPGLVYHAIGVNGAKISDFNKYDLFFNQLGVLQPDLVILSFGTNESFQRLSVSQYLDKIKEMVAKIKTQNPNTEVLVMTPPPSLLRRRTSNALVGEYSEALMLLDDLPIWDLYERMGGENGIVSKGKYADVIARDKIHYTYNGYRIQGQMFSEDFMKAYKRYKQSKEN